MAPRAPPPPRRRGGLAVALLLASRGRAAAADGGALRRPPRRRRLPGRGGSGDMAAAASHPFLPDYDSRSCRDDAPAPAWQTDVPDSASECCERYFAHPAGACEEATRAWIARSRGEAPKEYYPDPAHGLCKVATAATPAWITAREGDREACCRTHLGWNLEGCLAAAPGRARESPASGPPADRSSYGADHGEDSRLIAYVGSWQACPTPAQTDSYSHIVIAYAVSYTWSLAKNNCHDQCAIASTVPICENQNQQALVDQWRAAGKKVLLSFGGAGMGRSWSGEFLLRSALDTWLARARPALGLVKVFTYLSSLVTT